MEGKAMKMRGMRRRVALALSVLTLAACSGGAASGDAGTTGSAANGVAGPAASGGGSGGEGEPVVLRFLTGFTGGDRVAYEDLVETFNETHPGIRVEMDVQPWDSIATQLPGAMATGQGPDLATPDFNVATIRQYVEAGTIRPLDDLYGSGEGKVETDALPENLVEAFTVDGTPYAVPANFATLMLYYNEALFEEAGISSPPETMEELREAAVALTERDGDQVSQYGLALADHQTIPMWPILIWAEGGDVVGEDGCSALDDPETIAAVQSWADLIVEEGVSPVGQTGAATDDLFASGTAAMQLNGPWATASYTEAGVEYDVAPVPVGEAGPVTLASTVPIVVNANSENPEAAYEFLSWWTSEEAQLAFALASGFPPVRTDLAEDPALAEHPFASRFAEAADYARLYLPSIEQFAQVDADVFSPAIGRVTRGEPADEVLASAAEEMDALLECSAR